jgi:Fic family protein
VVAKLLKQQWEAQLVSGLSRRDRRPCEYGAYVPDRLSRRRFTIDGDVAADLSEAEATVRALDESARALSNSEALARLLLRAEAVASSRIEGLEVGGRRLLRAEADRSFGDEVRDVTAAEVLGNIEAMRWATGAFSPGDTLDVDGVREIHRRLLSDTPHRDLAGVVRKTQNWIGGSSYNPCSADFVPPPSRLVPRLLADLCEFVNSDALPPVAQAAVAHAQFETIHPFADGNGRTGRALVHVVLRRRGLIQRVVPPISLILATDAKQYIAGLNAFRHIGSPTSDAAARGVNRWLATFASATRRAATDAIAFEAEIETIQQTWRTALGRIRANSATDLLLQALPGAPIVTAASAAQLVGRSTQAANEAIRTLVAAGVLEQINAGRARNRAFEAGAVIDAFTRFERSLASPTRNTKSAPPARRVPAGPRRQP